MSPSMPETDQVIVINIGVTVCGRMKTRRKNPASAFSIPHLESAQPLFLDSS
jgi:hypothetical protein